MPRVSVAILTYNHAPFIAQALDSVLAQRCDFDFEICVGDDASTDGTSEIVADYARRFPDIVRHNLMPQKGAGIAGRANNMANLASTRGDYVAMLDGDDYWTGKDKLARQVRFLDAHADHAGAAHGSLSIDEKSGLVIRPRRSRGRDLTVGDVITPQWFQIGSLMLRRDALLPLPRWFTDIYSADKAIMLLVAAAGPIHYDDRADSVYRLHDASVSRQLDRRARTRIQIENWRIFLREFPALNHRRGQAQLAKHRATLAALEKRPTDFLRSAVRTMYLDPRIAAQMGRRAWRKMR